LDKDLTISFQQQQIGELLRINGEQAKAIEFLQARVHKLENNQKNNSSNSSNPHSSDMGKPKQTQSLRSSSGKKPGGQTGHTGETLYFSATPDEIITHAVSHFGIPAKISRV
jgi:transposase